ncbi:MAG: MarR family transcriptional regulator [Bacteroidota bacterium]
MEVIEQQASRVASLTLELLAGCQEEEERLASRFNASVSEIRTLRMFLHEQQLTVKALLGGMGISGSRLSRILESLEEKGHVTRSIDPEDRRSIDVCLTSKGSVFVRTLEEQYLQVHEKLLEDIPESLHASLAEGLERMVHSLRRSSGKT